MTTFALIAFSVTLSMACFALCRALRNAWASYDHLRAEWQQEREHYMSERDSAISAMRTFTEAAHRAIRTIEDEVERSTGHSREADALNSLARDVYNSGKAFHCVTKSTAEEFVRLGMKVPQLPLDIGQALALAVETDERARQLDRYLHQVTRLCLLEGREAHFIAETLSRMQRLHHGDGAAARRELLAVIDQWEKWETTVGPEPHLPYCLENSLEVFLRMSPSPALEAERK